MSITNYGWPPLQMQKTCNINDTLMKSSWFYSATCLQQNKIRACLSNKIEVYKGRKILFTETLSCIYDTNTLSTMSNNVINQGRLKIWTSHSHWFSLSLEPLEISLRKFQHSCNSWKIGFWQNLEGVAQKLDLPRPF